MTWDVGDLVPVRTELKVSGVLTNATMALTVTSPSGVVTLPAVTNPSTGVYTANVPATEAGDWLTVWSASGAATAVQPTQFSVEALGVRLVSLDDAKRHVNMTATDSDEELRSMIDSVTAMVEHEVGPVIPRTVTETVDVYGSMMVLSYPPVLSLTSVTAAQTPYTAPLLAALVLEAATGLVYYTAGGALPYGRYIIVYRAGRNPVPPAIRTAGLIILAHLWETQHNRSGGRPQFGQDDLPSPGLGFAMPNRARELLIPFTRAPAVA